MTLDRDTARALFDNAGPMPATAGGTSFASTSPFAPVGNDALSARMSGRSTRKGPDWRLIAPVGVAALCAGAVLLISSQRNDTQPGKTVAATATGSIPAAPPTPAPIAPGRVAMAVITPPASSIIEPPARTPTPVVRLKPRAEPAHRAPVQRAAPPPAEVSVPAPSMTLPAPVEPTPEVIVPAAPPVTMPQPDPAPPQI